MDLEGSVSRGRHASGVNMTSHLHTASSLKLHGGLPPLNRKLRGAAWCLIKQNENTPNKNQIQFLRIDALTQQSQG